VAKKGFPILGRIFRHHFPVVRLSWHLKIDLNNYAAMRHSDTFLLVAFALGHFFALCTAQDVTSLLPELGFSLPDFPFDFLFDERQVC